MLLNTPTYRTVPHDRELPSLIMSRLEKPSSGRENRGERGRGQERERVKEREGERDTENEYGFNQSCKQGKRILSPTV